MQKLFATLFFLLFTYPFLFSQSLKAYEKAGEKAFQQKNYAAALEYFKVVLDADAENLDARWKYAESAMKFYAYPEAEKNFLKIAKSKSAEKDFPLLNFRLGEAKKLQGEYDAAIVFFEKFLVENPSGQAEKLAGAKFEIENCRAALEILAEKTDVKITHLGKEINSPYSDFGAFQRGDTLYFSSYRFEDKKSKSNPKPRLTKMMSSLGGRRARDVGSSFPAADSTHVANGAMTRDGRFFFFNFCKNIEKTGEIQCKIYLTVKTKRGRWTTPQALPEPINLKNSTNTQPTIAYFNNKKSPVLMFSSDRPGGAGMQDLYSVALDSQWFCPCHADLASGETGKKDPKMPAFSAPENLKNLNTPGEDATPFFHAESQNLYFSSDGRGGLGGYDIFVSKLEGGNFSAPENAGAGLNSSYNDLYPFVGRDGKTGYFSSNRPGVFYLDEKNKACCHDIFAFQFPEKTLPKTEIPSDSLPKIVLERPKTDVPPLPSGNPNPVPGNPNLPPTLPAAPPKIQDFVGLPLYFDNDEPDKRTRKTTTKKTYEETVLTYLERQDEYRERFSTGLKTDQKDAAETEIDTYFEDEIRRGFDRLQQLSELILNRLQSGEPVEVIIKGFTSPRAETDYNLNLGKRRISSLRNHFQTWSEGILQPFILNGMLKISETSFGETTARAGISDDLKDERNSIFSPAAARERRVEILEIRE